MTGARQKGGVLGLCLDERYLGLVFFPVKSNLIFVSNACGVFAGHHAKALGCSFSLHPTLWHSIISSACTRRKGLELKGSTIGREAVEQLKFNLERSLIET